MTDREIEEIYMRHIGMVYRVCFMYLKNAADTEDVCQDTFVQLIKSQKTIEGEEYQKAWLIRTASNFCKDRLRHWWRKRENPDDHEDLCAQANFEIDEVMEAILGLSDRYRVLICLYYYYGYSGKEIAEMLGKPHSTIRNHLHEAREILKERLGGEYYEQRYDYQCV